MAPTNGLLIAIEGSDGAGKATQVQLLKKRLESTGYEVELFAFPRYDQPSSHFVRQYLKGAYGQASAVNPYTASLFYALDRYEAMPLINEALSAGKIVLADRYAGSNMAHQGSKFANAAERRGFFVWAESIEFQLLGIPRPRLNIFLRVPAEISYKLLTGREAKDVNSQAKDQHESNLDHLKSAVETYDMLCQLFAVDYRAVDCVENGQLMSRETIHNLVWQSVKPLLPPLQNRQPKPAKSSVTTAEIKKPQSPSQKPLTETTDKFKWQIDGISLVAAFGLQQAGLAVELDFDTNWAGEGTSYKYSIPDGINEAAQKYYQAVYEQAVGLHKKMNEKTSEAPASQRKGLKELLKLAVPMGAVVSARIQVDKTQATKILQRLRTHPNHEIAALGGSLAFALDSKAPSSDEDIHEQVAPQSMNEILDKINLVKQDYGADLEGLRIIEYSPRNEFELIADSVYGHSSLTRDEIMLALDRLTYDQKAAELKKALNIDTVLQLPTYRFDALTDWLTLSAVLSSHFIDVTHVQPLTIRYGYDVPAMIENIGLEDEFMEVFDQFLELFSHLQKEYDDGTTQYATLAGNKVRWQGRVNAGAVKEVLHDDEAGMNIIIKLLMDKVREVHPLIAGELRPAKKTNVRKKRKSSSRKKS
jgi:dTMP kinase